MSGSEETYPERAKELGQEVGRQLLQYEAMKLEDLSFEDEYHDDAEPLSRQNFIWVNFDARELARGLCERGYGTGEELFDDLTTRETDPFSDKDAETLIDLLRRV